MSHRLLHEGKLWRPITHNELNGIKIWFFIRAALFKLYLHGFFFLFLDNITWKFAILVIVQSDFFLCLPTSIQCLIERNVTSNHKITLPSHWVDGCSVSHALTHLKELIGFGVQHASIKRSLCTRRQTPLRGILGDVRSRLGWRRVAKRSWLIEDANAILCACFVFGRLLVGWPLVRAPAAVYVFQHP